MPSPDGILDTETNDANLERNLNDAVRVKVTPVGERIWAAHERRTKIDLREDGVTYHERELERDEEGYTVMQLYDVMQIFGPHMSRGTLPKEMPIATIFQFCD